MEYRIRRQGGFRRPRRTTGLPRLGTCAKQQSVLSPADGTGFRVYDITVDFTTMVVRFEPSQGPDYPTALYILGDAMPHGWDLGQAVAMTQTAPGIFTAENVPVKVGTANPDDNKGQRIQIHHFEQRMEHRIRRQGGFRRPRRTDGLPRLGTCAKAATSSIPC